MAEELPPSLVASEGTDASEQLGSAGAGSNSDPREARLLQALEHVRQALRSLRYGQVVITVQDGVVVQVDRTEKTRLR
ncbi:MAG: hypothetical protein C0483_17175 [Pirellula sp.]|nr:hypothetical protein [Pirellula sp.]